MGVARRAAAFAFVALLASGCVTVAEFRKLEKRVIDNERGGSAPGAHELRSTIVARPSSTRSTGRSPASSSALR